MSEWAYEMSNKDIIDAFGKACAQSGVSNSGICIDPMGPYHAGEAHYFRGVLLARLEGLEPPFNRGDVTKVKSGQRIRPVDWGMEPLPESRSHFTITRIHYDGNGKWFLEFEGVSGERGQSRFDADGFVPKNAAKGQ